MRKRSNEEKCHIVEESLQSGVTVLSVAGRYGVRPGQIFQWRRACKEGRLAADPDAPVLVPVRLSDVSRPARPAADLPQTDQRFPSEAITILR